ncbi:hypothetical protein V5799_013114, partial [Amblyomma americanum]
SNIAPGKVRINIRLLALGRRVHRVRSVRSIVVSSLRKVVRFLRSRCRERADLLASGPCG